MAYLKPSNSCVFTKLNLEYQRMNHFSNSFGIEEKFIMTISKFQKIPIIEPELQLFAQSDIESLPEQPCWGPLALPKLRSQKRNKTCLKEYHSTKPYSAIPPAILLVLPDDLRRPATIITTECAAIPVTSTRISRKTTGNSDRARTFLAQGRMSIFPLARRQWEQEETVKISSGSIKFFWPKWVSESWAQTIMCWRWNLQPCP